MYRVSVGHYDSTAGNVVFVCMSLELTEKKLPALDVGPVVEHPDKGSGDLAESPVDRDALEPLGVDGSGDGLVSLPRQTDLRSSFKVTS